MAADVLPAALRGRQTLLDDLQQEPERPETRREKHHRHSKRHSRSRGRRSDGHGADRARHPSRSAGASSSRSRSRSRSRERRHDSYADGSDKPEAAHRSGSLPGSGKVSGSSAAAPATSAQGNEPPAALQQPQGEALPTSAPQHASGSPAPANHALPSSTGATSNGLASHSSEKLASSASLPSAQAASTSASEDERHAGDGRSHRHHHDKHRHRHKDGKRDRSRDSRKRHRRSSRSRSRSRSRSGRRDASPRSGSGGSRHRRSATPDRSQHKHRHRHKGQRGSSRSRSRSASRSRSRSPSRHHRHHSSRRTPHAEGSDRPGPKPYEDRPSRLGSGEAPHHNDARNGGSPRPIPSTGGGVGAAASQRASLPAAGASSSIAADPAKHPEQQQQQQQHKGAETMTARGEQGGSAGLPGARSGSGGLPATDAGPASKAGGGGGGGSAAAAQVAAGRVGGGGGGAAVGRPKLSFEDEELEGQDPDLEAELLPASKALLSQHNRPAAPSQQQPKGPSITPRGAPTIITRMHVGPSAYSSAAPAAGPSTDGGTAPDATGTAAVNGSRSLPSLIMQRLGLPTSPSAATAAATAASRGAGAFSAYGAHRAGGIVVSDMDAGVDALGGSSSGLSSDEEEGVGSGVQHLGAGGGLPRGVGEAAGGKLGRVVFGVAQARCARPYMEDRHCCIPCWRPAGGTGRLLDDGVERSYCGVFDGHNGARTAEVAAQRLHALLAQEPAFRSCTGDVGPPASMASEEAAVGAAIKRAFRTLDDDVLQESEADGGRDGSTALMVLRLSDSLFVAHAGDSRAVLCCAGGQAMPLTQDHKPDLPGERARVQAAGGRVELQRCWRVVVDATADRPGSGLAVSRSLGDIDFKRPLRLVESMPDVARYVPRPGDAFVVLASDGLWDVLTDQDAVDVVSQSLGANRAAPTVSQLSAAAEAALGLAVRRGTMDNVTVVVMALPWGQS